MNKCYGCNEPEDFCTCPGPEEAAEAASLAIPTFDVTRLVPNDEFGRAAVALMRRAGKVGWDAALEEQVSSPSIDEPMWYDTIEALIEKKPFPKPTTTDSQRETWCTDCGDSGTVVARKRKPKHSNIEYETVRPCLTCAKGAAMFGWMSKEKKLVRVSASEKPEAPRREQPGGFKTLGFGD